MADLGGGDMISLTIRKKENIMFKKHALIMLACCLIPVAALIAISVFKIPISAIVYGLILLVCPLSHILMMKFMGHEHQQQNAQSHRRHTVIDVDAK
jgi:uncharacterized membrane protein